MDWIQRRSRSDTVSFTDVPSSDYVNTGSPEEVYTSILITNETDSANLVMYRCRAFPMVDKALQVFSDTLVNVTGTG